MRLPGNLVAKGCLLLAAAPLGCRNGASSGAAPWATSEARAQGDGRSQAGEVAASAAAGAEVLAPLALQFERAGVVHRFDGPVFGHNGEVHAGDQHWSQAGAVLGASPWAIAGNVRLLGQTAAGLGIAVVGSTYAGAPKAAHKGDWLALGQSLATARFVPVPATFLAAQPWAIAPDGAHVALVADTTLTLDGVVDGSHTDTSLPAVDRSDRQVCWADARSPVVLTQEGPTVRGASVSAGTLVDKFAIAARGKVVCDPGGGAFAIVGDEHLTSYRLTDGTALASWRLPAHHADETLGVAIGAKGLRGFAASRSDAVVWAWRQGAPVEDARWRLPGQDLGTTATFSTDGQRLAVFGQSLTVFSSSALPAAIATPMPRSEPTEFELPAGLAVVPRRALVADANAAGVGAAPTARAAAVEPAAPEAEDAYRWFAQFGDLSGLVPPNGFPRELLHATGIRAPADIKILRFDWASVLPLPKPMGELTDDELRRWALAVLAHWFPLWKSYRADGSSLALTVAPAERAAAPVRHLDRRWVDSREIMRDGCEWYDGYTRLVLDAQGVTVVRALVLPNGPIAWLPAVLALPLTPGVRTALRRGPRGGPC